MLITIDVHNLIITIIPIIIALPHLTRSDTYLPTLLNCGRTANRTRRATLAYPRGINAWTTRALSLDVDAQRQRV
eukprot:8246748-Lingulodinium_polyedra.AAC.1